VSEPVKEETGSSLSPHELAHAGVRGAVAAMAMTGMRTFTQDMDLVEETPPKAIFKERLPGLRRMVPRNRRRAAVELAHWGYGAVGGVAFGLLPDGLRRRAWAGPLYGLFVWLGFELGIAPALGLGQAKKVRPVERLGLAADHVLYGFVLSETRRRPQE
jgi:hypothetical protein